MLPVGQGNSFAELVQRGQMATCKLDNIVRQKDSPQLLAAVRQAVKGSTKISLDIISSNIREIKSHGHRLNAVAREYCKLSPEEQSETLVLTAKNADRVAINSRIRSELVQRGQLQQGQQFTIRPDEKKVAEQRFFSKGDKLVFLRNDKDLGVMNGTKGVISGIDGNKFTVSCGSGDHAKSVVFDIGNYSAVDHGYCRTPNKAQGATVNKAIIHMSSKDAGLNSKNSYYVDISRARKSVKLFCDSRDKLEPELDRFANKLTANDFEQKKKNRQEKKSAKKKKSKAVEYSGSKGQGKNFGGKGSEAGDINYITKQAVDAAKEAVTVPLDIMSIIPGLGLLTAPIKAAVNIAAAGIKIGARVGANMAEKGKEEKGRGM